jgi:type II secretory pathway component GspD/PulD (secretin)
MPGPSGARFAGAIARVALCASVSAPLAQGPPPAWPVSQLEQKPAGLPLVPVTQIDDQAQAQLNGPARLTMDFPKPMPVNDVLQLVVAGTPFSVVTDRDVTGTFAGALRDVTMRQALESVLLPLHLDYAAQGNVIRVFPRRPATRLFEVNALNQQRSVHRGIRSAVSLQGEPAAASVVSSVNSDLLADLARGVQAMLSASGRMHVDRTAGLVQVTDFEDRLDQIGVYLEASQLRASRQVRIETHVIEVTLYDVTKSTIDWAAVTSRSGVRTGGAAAAGFTVPDMTALLAAIAAQGSVSTIAAPRVLALNNEPAVMRVGTQLVSFDSASSIAEEDGGRSSSATSLFAGLTLIVTAQIASDGIVQLSVSPTYSEKTGDVSARAGGSVPVLTMTEADTIVRVQEGETVVISGLVQDRTRVRHASGFSGFFGAQTRETVKSELVILLTPTVVVPGGTSRGAM